MWTLEYVVLGTGCYKFSVWEHQGGGYLGREALGCSDVWGAGRWRMGYWSLRAMGCKGLGFVRCWGKGLQVTGAEEGSVSWEKRAMNVGHSTMQGKAFSLLQELVAMGKTWEKRRKPFALSVGLCQGWGKKRMLWVLSFLN